MNHLLLISTRPASTPGGSVQAGMNRTVVETDSRRLHGYGDGRLMAVPTGIEQAPPIVGLDLANEPIKKGYASPRGTRHTLKKNETKR